ncbi:hypothetical protein L2D08_17635 [Domibacillus sp. PGB-M46]|uniref:hypothetical protein n=1 Tax=Domibacillus sp. PGB-M46 TaxID=2910255 RepID=UPI001F59EC69|nr:hypothetical protein [Domibacillus sp. PGB-M46]MCI2256173.1 hypothetical protein [Domibacillus sp. PGB-M46]
MLNDHVKALSIISVLSVIAGLVLMFSSISFGTALGESWLQKQLSENMEADTSQYNIIVETYTKNFVIIGSVLFSAGFLMGILTYFTSALFGESKQK